MSYTVTMKRTGAMYNIGDDEAFDLKSRRATEKRAFPVEFDDDQYMSNEIQSIVKDKVTQADIPNFEQTALPAGPKCRAQYSIQNQINRLAMQMSLRESEFNPDAAKWSTLVRDTDWREMMRSHLRTLPNRQWCDGRAGECACKADYEPDPGRLDAIKALFFAPPSSTDLTETHSTGENDGVIANEPASATIIEEEGKVPVKVNPDGSTEMPDDFLAPEPKEPTPEDLF